MLPGKMEEKEKEKTVAGIKVIDLEIDYFGLYGWA